MSGDHKGYTDPNPRPEEPQIFNTVSNIDALKELENFSRGRGWALVKEFSQREDLEAIEHRLLNDPDMTELERKEMLIKRTVCLNFLELPETIIEILKSGEVEPDDELDSYITQDEQKELDKKVAR